MRWRLNVTKDTEDWYRKIEDEKGEPPGIYAENFVRVYPENGWLWNAYLQLGAGRQWTAMGSPLPIAWRDIEDWVQANAPDVDWVRDLARDVIRELDMAERQHHFDKSKERRTGSDTGGGKPGAPQRNQKRSGSLLDRFRR